MHDGESIGVGDRAGRCGSGLASELSVGISFRLKDQSNVLIRWMQANDVPAVYRLEQAIFPSPWTYDSFLYELSNHNFNLSVVGIVKQQVVAYAVANVVANEIHINNLAVAEAFRRRGIGERLLQMLLRLGGDMQCEVAHLEVRAGNKEAIPLYQKYGFQVVGVRKKYYDVENEDALLMSRYFTGER
ncbi:MAG: ribosomal protein S18-alanine N-acetyltransferase [candidate division KSB1 bacterium]|nr:ribosomal protein S18-alanine N-acetyltransferase [candidate division KSB1 bacterium]MDZ7319363.1 ribosomal protein S18-alanine N-acetyltransferase [candidate division KSB1 bacterium]MDZ7340215.1 ribosomal protein S18-alanine N-acetyltransferase [candidate division KSB1 bacterium]